MLRATSLHKSYNSLPVLQGVNFTAEKGEVIALLGASGAGKSTLLRILSGLEVPDKGNVFYQDQSIFKLAEEDLDHFRNQQMGFVFQFHHLLPEFTALENVCMPGYIAGTSKKILEEKASWLFNYLQLEGRKNHYPTTLSGGECQRVAVARALINQPHIVFADEPGGNLDSENAQLLHRLFFNLCQELQTTFIIATHDQLLANLAKRKCLIQDGIFVE